MSKDKTIEQVSRSSSIIPVLFLLIASTAAVAFAAWMAFIDDNSIRLSLVAIKPFVDHILPWGKILEGSADLYLSYFQRGILGFSGLVAITPLFYRTRAALSSALFVLATLGAIYAEVGLATRADTEVLWGGCAFGLMILLYFLVKRGGDDTSCPTRPPVVFWEVCAFLAIFAIALLTRFYALNYLFDYFEGEETPFTMAGNDLRAMTLANMGDGGPWSPFGLIYFVIVYIPTKIFGTTLLAMRFGAAIPAMIILTLIYFFVRDLIGRGAALATILALAIDAKQISWARYEFPHGSTALTAVLIVWLTHRSFHRKGIICPFLLAICMGLCFHQYPSGQTAVAIPWLYLIYLLVFNRDRGWGFYLSRVPFLALGALLWYHGHSFAYYLAYGRWTPPLLTGRFDSRVGWKAGGADTSALMIAEMMARMVISNAKELYLSMISAVQLSLPPQDHVPGFGPLTTRTIFLVVPPFSLVALCYFARHLRWRQGALLLAWIVVASAPCLLSNQGYPRRAATVFPALICLAGVGYWICREMLARLWGRPWRFIAPLIEIPVACCLALASIHQWFGMSYMRIAEPGEMVVYRKIRDMLQPGTLAFFEYQDHYMPGRMTYLLLDALNDEKNKPVVWSVVNVSNPSYATAAEDPREAAKQVKHSIEYRWSNLRRQVPLIESYDNWKRLIYISERTPNSKQIPEFDERQNKVLEHCENHEEVVFGQTVSSFHIYRIVACDLKPLAP
jgi:hypothetical protein